MLNINHVIKRMEELDINQSELAEKLGEKQQTVNAWFIRKSFPKNKTAKVLNVLSMDLKDAISRGDNKKIRVSTIGLEVGAAKALDVETVQEYINGDTIEIDSNGVNFTNVNNLIGIKVNGLSMLPTLLPNDYVIIDLGDNLYSGDDLYVLNYSGNLLVKRLQYDPSINSVEIISDNPQFKNYTVSLTEDQSFFNIVGKVIAKQTR